MNDLAFSAAIEMMAEKYGKDAFQTEVHEAREQFDQLRGRVYLDDVAQYEKHLDSFLEWYLLERPLNQFGYAPIFAELNSVKIDEEKRIQLRAMALSYRSLFQILNLKEDNAQLGDLIGGGLWRVRNLHAFDGSVEEDILEARLIPWNNEVILGPNCNYHPREARQSICSLIEQAEEKQLLNPQLVFRLFEMSLRFSRVRHIPAERIYHLL